MSGILLKGWIFWVMFTLMCPNYLTQNNDEDVVESNYKNKCSYSVVNCMYWDFGVQEKWYSLYCVLVTKVGLGGSISLTTVSQQEERPIRQILYLGNLLETCHFQSFWVTRAHGCLIFWGGVFNWRKNCDVTKESFFFSVPHSQVLRRTGSSLMELLALKTRSASVSF